MKSRHQVSRAAIELIKSFEGYRRKAAQLPDGRWTIGYGHTLTAREGAEVSEADAEALLMYDLINVAHAVNEHSYTPLTQNQFDALCCFAFNVGVDNFRRSSVLRRVNEGQLLQAACAMEMWRKADFEGERIVIDALVRRRSAEKTLFLTPANGWIPAPSPVLRPRVDYDVVAASPRETPTALKTSTVDDKVVVERDETNAPRPTAPSVEPHTAPLATEIAAAGVGAALEQLMPDPAPEAPEAVVAGPTAEPEPEAPTFAIRDLEPAPPPVIAEDALDTPVADEPVDIVTVAEVTPRSEPESEGVAEPVMTVIEMPQPESTPSPGPVLAVVNGDVGFTLTPAPEVSVEATPGDAFRIDLPEPANESAPGLFDVTFAEPVHQGGATRPLVNEDYIRRLVREDEMADLGADFTFDAPTEPVRVNGLPLFVLGLGGIALFAGGVAWGWNAQAGEGLLNPLVISWGVGLTGIGMAGFAAWRLFRNMFDAPFDDDEEDEGDVETDERAQA
ncbi:MAG: glycoside hydrolase family protein [Caulobacter sp.]|nr:glycoside hydrolase family protein [Caulobacter sp.]